VLARRFPNTVVWFGESTRQWWALVWCGRWHLVEAVAPEQLTRAIINTACWHGISPELTLPPFPGHVVPGHVGRTATTCPAARQRVWRPSMSSRGIPWMPSNGTVAGGGGTAGGRTGRRGPAGNTRRPGAQTQPGRHPAQAGRPRRDGDPARTGEPRRTGEPKQEGDPAQTGQPGREGDPGEGPARAGGRPGRGASPAGRRCPGRIALCHRIRRPADGAGRAAAPLPGARRNALIGRGSCPGSARPDDHRADAAHAAPDRVPSRRARPAAVRSARPAGPPGRWPTRPVRRARSRSRPRRRACRG